MVRAVSVVLKYPVYGCFTNISWNISQLYTTRTAEKRNSGEEKGIVISKGRIQKIKSAQPQRDRLHHTSLQATGALAGKQTLILKLFCERLAYNMANFAHPTFSNSWRTLQVQIPTIWNRKHIFKDRLNRTNTGCRWHQLCVTTRPVQDPTVESVDSQRNVK